MKTIGYAAHSRDSKLVPYHFDRRELRNNDVSIEIMYCGVCHSDLHTSRNDWGHTIYPNVPGHEIIGRVVDIGSEVTKFKIGDYVGVGCLVDSCKHCEQCDHGNEQYCLNGRTDTYNAPDRITGENNYGGYSKHVVVRDEFVLRIPNGLDINKVAPLLCAGITTYSPLKEWGVKEGTRVAVVGLGGLGHMAVKLASAMGAHVTVLSRTPAKKKDAEELGADALLISTDDMAMQKAANQFDIIINTIPVKHDISPYIPLLKIDGTMVLVGQIGLLSELNTVSMVMGRRRIAGSLIGGIRETQEMLDFCASKNVLPECEMIRMDEINEAFERMEKSDVRYRFVIDMSSLSI